NQTNRAGDRNLLFDVEQQALVAAEHEPCRRVLRPDGADVEAADAVLTAKEQLLENRQIERLLRERVDVLELPAHAERQARRLMDVPDAFEERLPEVGVAAEAGEVNRRGEALPRRRKDRLVDRVVDVRRHDLADDPLALLSDEQ